MNVKSPHLTHVEEVTIVDFTITNRVLGYGTDSTSWKSERQSISVMVAPNELTQLFEHDINELQYIQLLGTSNSIERFIHLFSFSNQGWDESFEKFTISIMKLVSYFEVEQFNRLKESFNETEVLLQYKPSFESFIKHVKWTPNPPLNTYRIVVQQMSQHLLVQDSDTIVTIYQLWSNDKERISLKFSLKFALLLACAFLDVSTNIQTITDIQVKRAANSQEFVDSFSRHLQKYNQYPSLSILQREKSMNVKIKLMPNIWKNFVGDRFSS